MLSADSATSNQATKMPRLVFFTLSVTVSGQKEMKGVVAEQNGKDIVTALSSSRKWSNRFSCYFEGAAATIFHQENIAAFLWDGVSHSNLKLQSIELRSRPARPKAGHPPVCCSSALLQSYRTLLEAVAECCAVHQVPRYVQKMATLFAHWQTDPSGILDPAFVGIFDG